MKKTIVALMNLLPAAFTVAAGPASVANALGDLESSLKSLAGVSVFVCSGPLFLIFLISAIVYYTKRNDPTKKWILYVAIASLLVSMGIVIFYLLIPVIIRSLIAK